MVNQLETIQSNVQAIMGCCTIVSICYKDWFEVPDELKEKLWSCVEGKPCKLAVGSIENIVAHGMMYERIEPNEAICTVPLGESNVRVLIQVAIQKDAPLPIAIPDEMLIIGQAVGFFVAWPKNLVFVDDEGALINVECGKYQEPIQSFVSLVEYIKYDEAMHIPLEKNIFGEEINIQLQRVYMEYICHVKELSVTCIMLYISHLHQVLKTSNWRKQFVFVNPCVVSGKTMAGEKSKSVLLARRLEETMLEQLILIPYNIGSLKIYETTQRRRRTNPVWKVVQVTNIIFSNFIILIFVLIVVQLDHNALCVVSNNNENAFM
ncbi:uncharacterized protein LOC114289635 [Camellia sinensis]|uniref:uncharacterized protein LOC114289635 n=1 Tax=Camellia sinensis TaxID=4442 RepID=UPI0010366ACE|nr:uncharacterized protein LOC114289635 [Camellia sinensis]